MRHQDGHWFLTKILPYRTDANTIDGVVITFTDVTKQKKAQETAQDASNYANGILETVREPLLVLDHDLVVNFANPAFYRMFKVAPGDTEGLLVYELGNLQWDIPALRELLEKVLSKSAKFEGYEVEHEFQNVGKKKMSLNARRIYRQGKRTDTILLAFEDITGSNK